MLSKRIKNAIITTSVALAMGTSFILPSSLNEPIRVEAAVMDRQSGNLTVTAYSLWTYGSANWADKIKTYSKGTIFTVTEKHSVDGREMYKLTNGLFISANPAYVSFSATAGTDFRVTMDNLNLRSGAGTSYQRILTIPKGAEVTVLSESNGWAKLDYNGKVGFASSEYLRVMATTTPPEVETPTFSDSRETTDNLNMRTGAGTQYAVILTIPKGGKATVLSESNGWAKLDYNGKVGYASSQYLKSMETTPESPTPPVVETPSTNDERKTTENLNIRTGAGTENKILLTMPKGSSVLVLDESNGWAKVDYKGTIGYASAEYLEKVENAPPIVTPEPLPVPTPEPEPMPEPAPEEQPAISKDLRIVTGNLYLRADADGESSILTILAKGTIVEVESLSGKWAKLTHEGMTGYASTKYMSPYGGETPEEPKEEIADIRETTNNLNLRKGPGTDQDILLTIPKGTFITILEIEGDWGKVTYNGQMGYVSIDYLTKVTTPDGQESPELYGQLDNLDQVHYKNEDITVSGWAKMETGVKDVKVYLNSRIQGTANYGVIRSDQGNSSTGYRYTVKRNSLFPGENKILVVVTGNQGERFTYTRTIQVNKVPVIVIDPGHGGKDSGAAGLLNGFKVYEKTYVLQFASALNDALSTSGFKTVMTRNSDQFIELSDRAKIGNDQHADLFFSLHHDYNGSSTSKGAFVIYPSMKTNSISDSIVDESMDVAGYVKKSLMDMGFDNRRNGTDKSISGYTLAVLRQTQTRSILAEIGYMSNAEDLSKISDPVFQKAMAYNLTKQLKAYFKMN